MVHSMKYGEITTGCILKYEWVHTSYIYLIVDIYINANNRITAYCLTPSGKLDLWCSGRNLNECIEFDNVSIISCLDLNCVQPGKTFLHGHR